MIEKIKTDGIILDIDGTLWDSTGIVSRAWNRAAREALSVRNTLISAEELKGQFGKPMDEIADNVFPLDSTERKKEILDLCCRYEHEELTADPCDIFFPGVIDTIIEMSGIFPFFIVSNCQTGYIELVCEKAGITHLIKDHECFGNTGEGKAANLSSLILRNGLKAPVYIGDTEGDRTACEEAGVPFIYAEYGFGELSQGGAAAVIDSFDMIKDIFE